MSYKYILKGHKPVKCNDLMKWARWYEKADRVVKQEAIITSLSVEAPISASKVPLNNCKASGVRISTVFLGRS